MTKPIEYAGLCFLTSPLIIFCAEFLSPWIAVPSCILILRVLYADFRKISFVSPDYRAVLCTFGIAAIWTVLSGAIPPLSPNWDWAKHFALLELLTDSTWPVEQKSEFLRYSVAYYLVPAALAKLIGANSVHWLVGFWTLLGAWLALLLMTSDQPLKRVLIASVVFVFFSGLDVIGTWITGYSMGPIGHIEWWARWWELPSQTTGFFWAPQHALAAWIGLGLIFSGSRHSALILVAVSLWSPFVAVGLIPFIIFWNGGFLLPLLTVENFVCALLELPIASYLLSGTGDVQKDFIWNVPGFTWNRFALFLLLEWGLLVCALWYAGANHRKLVIIVSTLLLACIVSIGGADDMLMRASAPALTGLAVLSAQNLNSQRAIPLLLLLLLGAPTAIAEMARPFLVSGPDYSQFTFEQKIPEAFRSQYFSKSKPPVLR